MVTQFIVLFALVFLSGYIDAIAGGGGLIALPAYMFAGVPIHETIGTNMLSSSIGMSASLWRYTHNGYLKRNRNICIVAAIFAVCGTIIGSELSVHSSERTLMVVMLFVLPVVAGYVLKNKTLTKNDNNPLPQRKTMLLVAIIAFFVGGYGGFYGPGAGTFLLLGFTGIAHLSLNEAAGVGKLANFVTNMGALVVFLANGEVIVLLGLAAGVFSFLGNLVGSKHFTQNGSKIARPIILVVVVIFMIRLIHDLFFV